MSNVEDTRKAIQDFIAPDLKAIGVRLDALEKDVKTGFESAEKINLERFAAAEKLAAARHETYLANHASVMSAIDTEKGYRGWKTNGTNQSRHTLESLR